MKQPFEYLQLWANQTPDAIAISTVTNDTSYRSLHDSAVRFAHVFRELGIKPGDVVGIHTKAYVELVVTQALFHEAAVSCVLPAGYLANLDYPVDWVVTQKPISGFPEDKQIILGQYFLNRAARQSAEANPLDYPSDDALMRIVFSSGTTGRPKAVPITLDRMATRAFDLREQWLIGNPMMCLLGPASMLTFVVAFSQIAHGETYVLPGKASEVIKQVSHNNVAALIGSPHQLSDLAKVSETNGASLSSLTTIGSIGAVLPESVGQALTDKFHAKVVSLYGSSEAGIVARREGAPPPDGHAGTLLDGVEVRIINAAGEICAEGESGLIGVKRALLPEAYLGEPEISAEAFRDGFFYAGDRGYVIGRELYLSGRDDELINAAGTKVDPAKVESVAMGFPKIKDAAAFGADIGAGLQVVGLAFVTTTKIDPEEFARFMSSQLGDAAPRHYIRVKKIPRTKDTGKVLRAELTDLAKDMSR